MDLGMQWKDLYWKIEEFINLYEDLNAVARDNFSQSEVSDLYSCPESIFQSLLCITSFYGRDTGQRLFSLVSIFYDTDIKTIGHLYEYCKSRRLHFASMLYLIPMYAKGDKRIGEDKLYKELSWCIEEVAVNVTTAFNAMLQCRCLSDFEATVRFDGRLEFSDAYAQLEIEIIGDRFRWSH